MSTHTPTTDTRPCGDCGAPVTRELAVGAFAEKINALPFYCDDCIRVAAEQSAAEELERRDEQQQRNLERRLKDSGMPNQHRVMLGDLEHTAALLVAAEDWALQGGGLLLTGDIGRGKTTIAGAACWLRLQSHPVIWTSAPLLLARLGSGLDSEAHAWAVRTLAGRTALVLDDIDKARPTPYGAEQVFLAVDQRVEHEAPLLVTTNLSPGQLAEKWPEPYGPAIASRLVGYCKVARVEGTDRRLGPPRRSDAGTGA